MNTVDHYFSWQQIGAWRLKQHSLLPRLAQPEFIEAVSCTGGIQAQVMSAAELAIWARVVDLTPGDVRSALWRDKSLIKIWAMRGTLHLLSARDLPLYVAARDMHADRNWLNYFTHYGISEEIFHDFMRAVPEILGSEPMTKEELATAVSQTIKAPELRGALLSSSWGSLWKPSALRGDLCFGPNQGRYATFVNPRSWLSEWQTFEPVKALQEIARRYLMAFGPANPEDFALWWDGGSGVNAARTLFRSIEKELAVVDVQGWRAFVLRTDLEALQQVEIKSSVRLLPLFDAYLLGLGRDVEVVLPRVHKHRVYRPQGWVSAVVLEDGCIKGVWDYMNHRSETTLTIRLFTALNTRSNDRINFEAERLGAYFNKKVVVETIKE